VALTEFCSLKKVIIHGNNVLIYKQTQINGAVITIMSLVYSTIHG